MSEPLPAWDGRDIAALMALDAIAPNTFRIRCGEANAHGRSYGGQVLGQAIAAAAGTVPAGRAMTALQFMFLQGTQPDAALELRVTPLQDGKRFATRHVRGVQRGERGGERFVFDAQVSFAARIDGAPEHGALPKRPLADPETLPTMDELPRSWADAVDAAVGYRIGAKDGLDFRFDAPPEALRLERSEPTLRFWLRLVKRLGDDPHLHAAAFAYLSDWWLNFAAIGAHQDEARAAGGLYVASLNHAIWLHRVPRADEWLHFESVSPAAADGRGLSIARVRTRDGTLVASCTQECLMAPRGG